MAASRLLSEGTTRFILGASVGAYAAMTGGLETAGLALTSSLSTVLDGLSKVVAEGAKRGASTPLPQLPQTIVVQGGGGRGEASYAWTGLGLTLTYIALR